MIYELSLNSLMANSRFMGTCIGDLQTSTLNYGEDVPLSKPSRDTARMCLEDLTAGMPVSPAMRVMVERALVRLRKDKELTERETANLLDDLHEVAEAEFRTFFCLVIDEAKAQFYGQKAPFGLRVADRFSDASSDIAAASRCIALGESTAAVFHLMRAVELALQSLATKLGVKGVVVKEWSRLLHDIDAALAALRQKPRTAKRDRDLEYFSQARAMISGFNDAWRKHVAHSRGKYDERDAMDVWNSVKPFMQLLARRTAAR